jgi:hypothetical protein
MKQGNSWLPVPAFDLELAIRFGQSLFGICLIPINLPNRKIYMFPANAAGNMGFHPISR